MDEAQQWVVSLAHYPEPALDEGSLPERAAQLLATWRNHVPFKVGEGDFEDFFEQAARLDAALDAFGAANCWLFLNDGPARNLTSGIQRQKAELLAEGALDYGILHAYTHFDSGWQRGNDVVDTYIASPAFQRAAGRALIACGFVPDDPDGIDLRDALVNFSAKHPGKALIKVARAKHGFFPLELPANLTRPAAEALMWEVMDMLPLNYEGRSKAFLLQQWVEMNYEYRFFVVGGEVVTGAGCVEEFTPLDNHGSFDARVRRRRAASWAIEVREDLLAAYLPFAKKVAAEIAAEGELRTFTLDVALGADGAPLVIELNGLPNSGLYASDPRCVARALAAPRSGHAA